MADKKLVEQITSRDEDFAKWYTDVVTKAELCDYTSVKGCMVLRPAGYAIWENIMHGLDKRFKETGVENCAMPLFIPESLLNKEKEHVEGFAPEVAWVTEGGSEKLEERLCVRPTSETLFCDYYAKTIKSWRDLPQLLNQWCSVVRWEKTTRPFLRSREFWWQEGHTMHESAKEASDRTIQMLNVYASFCEEELAIPVIKGEKTAKERFAGAIATYTIEAIMHDGKALQSGTSHNFGDGFAKAYDINFLDRDSKLATPHQTSWGMSTRIIGALIMVHGDDSGLKLPPHIAPCQVMVVPIQMEKEEVVKKATEIYESLKKAGIRCKIDLTDKRPGYKFSEQEMRGIPLRIEIGARDIENNVVMCARRDSGEKFTVSMDNLENQIKDVLENIQKNMYESAKSFLNEHTSKATSVDEILKVLKDNPGFVKAMWCGDRECEDKLKDLDGITSRCIPFEQEQISDKCAICGKPAKHMVIWGKAY
jgi:prolyl-tRNA synthetase